MPAIDNNASIMGAPPPPPPLISVWDTEGNEHKMSAANAQDMVMHNKWTKADPTLVNQKTEAGDYGDPIPKEFERPKQEDAAVFEVFDKQGNRHFLVEGSAVDVIKHLGWTTRYGEGRDGKSNLGPAVEFSQPVAAVAASVESQPLNADDDPVAVAKKLNRLRGAPTRIEGQKVKAPADSEEDTSAYNAIDLDAVGGKEAADATPIPRVRAAKNLSAMSRDALATWAKDQYGLDFAEDVKKEAILQAIAAQDD